MSAKAGACPSAAAPNGQTAAATANPAAVALSNIFISSPPKTRALPGPQLLSKHRIDNLSNKFLDVVNQPDRHESSHSTMQRHIVDALPTAQDEGSERLEVQVYKDLLDKIRFGTFRLGQKLPSEHELAEEHNVSRPVIRAALSKLRDSGLIVSRRGAGSFVNSGVPTEASGYTPLGSVSDISNYFDFRRTIEGEIAALAAQNGGPDAAKELRGIAEEVLSLLANGEDSVGADIRFHTTLAELSDNRFLLETLGLIRSHWIFIGNFVRSLGATRVRTGQRMTNEHFAIADAVGKRDPVAARKAMLLHIDGSQHRVFKGDK
jgi:DNA-binding FadR family transcriptional regulator